MVMIRLLALSLLLVNTGVRGVIPCNQQICSLDIVIITQLQNNRCDLNCMHAACQFDSFDAESSNLNKENSGCLQSCLISNSHCRYEMLGDGKCDHDCNSQVCGWDWGDCGYCSRYCTLAFLEKQPTACVEECNVSSCYFQKGACGSWCSEGCSKEMVENEVCEKECYNIECSYDMHSCDEQCYDWMLGNGICEEQCNTPELNYDEWDCTCAPYCKPDMLINTVCEPDCYTEKCEFVGKLDCMHKPKNCSPGCISNYPYKVCQLECLTWDCKYYDNQMCDERIKLHAFYIQMIRRDINNTIDIYKTCLKHASKSFKNIKTPYCTLEKLGDKICHPECNTEDCAYDLGDCYSDCDISCELCYENQNDRACLKCKDNMYLLYTACFKTCPYGFDPDIKNGIRVCVLSSIYTRFLEHTLYVSQDTTIPYELQDGDVESPFSSLTDAFAHIRARAGTVILLNYDNSSHFLKPVNMDKFEAAKLLKRDDRPLDFGGLVVLNNLMLIGYMCNSFNNKKCYENNAVIKWSGLKPIQLDVSSLLYISNVDFYGYNPIKIEPCILEEYKDYCTYCQNTWFDYDSFIRFDDHGQEIIWDYADKADCERYQNSTLFQVHSTGQLEIYNGRISYWRAGFSSLILNSSGVIKLDSVEFSNLILSSKLPSAVILSECNDNSYQCGEIYIRDCEISLLNNGYEYNPKRYFSGFVYARGVYQIKIEKSRFRFNLAYRGYDTLINAPGLGSLIYIENFLIVYISENDFTSNISEYLIDLKMNTVYSNEYDIKVNEYPSNLHHVTLDNINFTNNYSGLIAARLEYELPNFIIDRITSTSNISNRELISIYLNAYRDVWLNNKYRNIKIENQSHGYTLIRRNAIISNISIISSYSPTYLLSFINIGNLNLQSLSIHQSIQHSHPTYSYINSIYSLFKEYPYSYINQNYIYKDLTFTSSLAKSCYMRGISRIKLHQIEIIENFSETGTDIEIHAPLVSLEVSDMKIERNLGHREKAVLGLSIVEFDIEVDIDMMHGMENRNMNMNSYGVIYLFSKADCIHCNVKIKNSTFNKNLSGFGAAISTFIRSLYIDAVVFEENSINSGYGGSLYLNARGIGDYSIEISNTIFYKHTILSGKGGTIAIDNSKNTAYPLNFILFNSTFTSNISSEESSIIYILPSVMLSSTSSISYCSFSNNISRKGNIFLEYYLGVLTFQDCIFEGNHGDLGVAIWYDIDHFNINSAVSTKLMVNRCLFHNNTSRNSNGSVIHISGLSADFKIITSNCSFVNNQGSAMHIRHSQWNDDSSIFNSNYAERGSVIQISLGAQAIITRATIIRNLSNFNGAFELSGSATLILKDSEITNNQSNLNGGVIFMERRSILIIENCLISENSACKKGSVIYSIGCDLPGSAIISSKIYSNQSKDGGSIYLLSSYLNITSTEIYNNTDSSSSPGIMLNLSVLNIFNSTIYNQSGISGTGIYAMADSKILIQACNLSSLHAQISGGVIYSFNSYIIIQNSSINNILSLTGGAILAYSNTVLEISETEFYNSRADQGGGVILAILSEVKILRCTFTNFKESAIYGRSLKSLIVLESIFREGIGKLGGSIFCGACLQIRVIDSIFEEIKADIGGAIYANNDNNADIITNFEVESSKFIHNSALIGGALFVDSLNLIVFNSSFKLNSAYSNNDTEGEGGALSIQCSYNYYCNFNLNNNYFANNHADRNGGAIWWRHSMPELLNNEFLDNTGLYGNSISTYPSSIKLMNSSNTLTMPESSNPSPLIKSELIIGEIGYLVPGEQGLPIIIKIQDPYNNTAITDSISIGEIYSYDATTIVSGKTKLIANRGIYEFLDYTVSAKPGTRVRIIFKTNAIQYDNFKNSRIALYNYGTIYIHLRNCTRGEKTTEDKCIKCPKNTYTIDPLDTECKECPRNARCYGEFYIVPQPGYWRSSLDSDRIFECLLKEACLGSREFPNIDLTGRCREGYEGNLCHGCSVGYSRSIKNTCSKCPEESVNIVRLVFSGIGVIFVVGWIVRATMKSAYKPKSIHSIYLKILINYLQPISILAGLGLEWPEYVLWFLRHQENAVTMSEQILSLDCLLYSEEYLIGHEDLYFFKLTLMLALPLLMSIFALLFWCIVAVCSRKWRYIRNEMISTIIILQFLVHPSLVTSMFGAFNCIELEEGEYWLGSNLEIACWSELHIYYTTRIALPGIMAWGILIPGVCLVLLLKFRKRIGDVDFKLKFGFLYNGYESKYCYWEIVIMYRKIIIIFISVFLGSISVLIQSLSVIVVLLVAYYLQKKHSPYRHSDLNRMEQRSILVGGATIYCGLFYLSDNIGDKFQYVIFSIIIAVNAYLFAVLGTKLIASGLAYIVKKLPYLRKRFGNRQQEVVESLVFLPNITNFKTNQVNKKYLIKDSDELSKSYLSPSYLKTSKDLYMCIVKKKNIYKRD